MSVHVLSSELLHICKSCGGSCQGLRVRLIGKEEEDRITDLADKIGVENAVEDGLLRKKDGKCIFLADDNMCEIHRQYGLEAKPAVCQQFPVIAIRVDDGIRVGIDPACYTSILTWRDGPEVPSTNLLATSVPLQAGQEPTEAKILDLLQADDITLSRLASVLCGEQAPWDGNLPPEFAKRVVTRLQEVDLKSLLTRDHVSPMVQANLGPVLEAAATWDADNPPAWPVLAAHEEAYAIDVMQRVIFLRLGHLLPIVAGAALVNLMGIIAVGWTTQERLPFGHGLAAWTQAVREPTFLGTLVPDGKTLAWLAHGVAR